MFSSSRVADCLPTIAEVAICNTLSQYPHQITVQFGHGGEPWMTAYVVSALHQGASLLSRERGRPWRLGEVGRQSPSNTTP